MRLVTPEIVWHSKEPLLSADFHRTGPTWRLATGGADNDVKIWKLLVEEGIKEFKVVFMASLCRHTKAVNVVRFSPNGEFLASAGDDSVIHIWKMSDSASCVEGNLLTGSSESSPSKDKENWSLVKLLRGHLEDIYDLCWSPDSSGIISGSVDNSAIVWDIQKGQQVCQLKESKQYIQGVAWDPLGKYVATLSTDRNLRIYCIEQKFKCIHTVDKLSLLDSKQFRLWLDEGSNSFFRRLAFSPDGSFLIVPAGRFESDDKVTNSTYVFARNCLSKPALRLPGPDKATVAVRCCPVLFELLDLSKNCSLLTTLPYRMVYAVASLDSVLFYDTQHEAPFAYICNIHYSGITDMAWSDNGLTLVITSTDCYCTVVLFELGELGTPLSADKLPAAMMASKNPTVPSRSPLLNGSEQLKTCSVSPQKDERATKNGGVPENTKQMDSIDCCPLPMSPVSSSSQSNSNLSNTETSLNGSESKPRRIRPTMISSFTSPNRKISSSVEPNSASQEPTTDSPGPKSVPDPLLTVTSPILTTTSGSQITPADRSGDTTSTASDSRFDRDTAPGSTRKPIIADAPVRDGAKESGLVGSEVKPFTARRVNFTTLDTLTSLSSSTQRKTRDNEVTSGEDIRQAGGESKETNGVIVIE